MSFWNGRKRKKFLPQNSAPWRWMDGWMTMMHLKCFKCCVAGRAYFFYFIFRWAFVVRASERAAENRRVTCVTRQTNQLRQQPRAENSLSARSGAYSYPGTDDEGTGQDRTGNRRAEKEDSALDWLGSFLAGGDIKTIFCVE